MKSNNDLIIDFDGVHQAEHIVFDMYFANICAMQMHPGAGTKDHKALSIEECNRHAIEMLKSRRRVFLNQVFGG